MAEIGWAVRFEVRQRAQSRCEYCLVPESLTLSAHEIDHIIALKHGGAESIDNLALCCTICNRYKGSDLASIDPETGEVCRLFHRRLDKWHDHFQLQRGEIVAKSSIGRVTVRLLRLNQVERVRERELMARAGALFP